jgi:hypothetical protein
VANDGSTRPALVDPPETGGGKRKGVREPTGYSRVADVFFEGCWFGVVGAGWRAKIERRRLVVQILPANRPASHPNYASFQVATKLRSSSLPYQFELRLPHPHCHRKCEAVQDRPDQSSTMSCSKRSRTEYKFATLPCLLGYKIFCQKQRAIDVMLQSSQHL